MFLSIIGFGVGLIGHKIYSNIYTNKINTNNIKLSTNYTHTIVINYQLKTNGITRSSILKTLNIKKGHEAIMTLVNSISVD